MANVSENMEEDTVVIANIFRDSEAPQIDTSRTPSSNVYVDRLKHEFIQPVTDFLIEAYNTNPAATIFVTTVALLGFSPVVTFTSVSAFTTITVIFVAIVGGISSIIIAELALLFYLIIVLAAAIFKAVIITGVFMGIRSMVQFLAQNVNFQDMPIYSKEDWKALPERIVSIADEKYPVWSGIIAEKIYKSYGKMSQIPVADMVQNSARFLWEINWSGHFDRFLTVTRISASLVETIISLVRLLVAGIMILFAVLKGALSLLRSVFSAMIFVGMGGEKGIFRRGSRKDSDPPEANISGEVEFGSSTSVSIHSTPGAESAMKGEGSDMTRRRTENE